MLDQGEVVERGIHEELLAAHGIYYDLCMSQFRREAEEENGEIVVMADVSKFLVLAD